MPTSFRPSAGSSRRNPRQQQEPSSTHPSRRTVAASSASYPAGSTGSSTRPQLASATRHRSAASSTATAPVHADSTAAAIDLTNPLSALPNSSTLLNHARSGIAPDDLHLATLNALGDWSGGILGLGNYFPTTGYWDDEYDDEYDEEYEEDQEELEITSEEEGGHDDEDEDGLDEDDDLDDFDDQDADLLALAEEESLFLEDDYFLGGDEDGDSLLTQGFHQHQALLDLLIGDELSSPSSYPSLIHGPSWHFGLDQPQGQSSPVGTRSARAAAHRIPSPPSPSRTTTQQTNLTTGSVVITDDEEEEDNTPNTSFSDDMPPTTRRGSHQSLRIEPPTKRRRTSTTRRPSTGTGNKFEPIKLDDDGLFNDPPARKPTEGAVEDLPTLDLTNATEVPEELQEPHQDNRIKLAAFQCVICMDDVTNLTVTHCGHLYCAECLHSSIHTGATKGRCPMCRQKLEVKPRENYTAKTKGHWLLELKVMTSTRKGKRKAET